MQNQKSNGAHTSQRSQYFTMLGISLVICRNKEGKWLAVKETGGRGWWVPGGLVDPPESFFEAAIRETQEEAGIDVELKGILRTEYNINGGYQRMKLVFYAEPIDQNQKPKSVADYESDEARWVTLQELVEMKSQKPGWRGPELYEWAKYIEDGGTIYPLHSFDREGAKIKMK